MTPEEKEKFREKVKSRMQDVLERGGVHAVVTEMEMLVKEIDEGKI